MMPISVTLSSDDLDKILAFIEKLLSRPDPVSRTLSSYNLAENLAKLKPILSAEEYETVKKALVGELTRGR